MQNSRSNITNYVVTADILTNNPNMVQAVLSRIVGVDGILRTENGFHVRATMSGVSAVDLNRSLLSALKAVDDEISMSSSWSSSHSHEQFVDFELAQS